VKILEKNPGKSKLAVSSACAQFIQFTTLYLTQLDASVTSYLCLLLNKLLKQKSHGLAFYLGFFRSQAMDASRGVKIFEEM